MDEQTRVNQMKVREQRRWIQPPLPPEHKKETKACLTELPNRPKGWKAWVQPDNLSRNLAMIGCLALVLLAVNRSTTHENVSVFSALKDEVTASWDQDIGKLSFVSDLLPPDIRAVWNPSAGVSVTAPVNGEVVHAWSRQEPYLEMMSAVTEVRAAGDGEVMSIAHGLEEERVVRIRHEDESETLYGNLKDTFVEVGNFVKSGEIIGSILPEKPLAFELRVEGRSIDPVPCMAPLAE